LAIIFEESWGYEFSEMKKAKSGYGSGSGGGDHGGVSGEWEEVFSFGEEDDNDYWSGTDCLDCDE
jgi:hypothetical protein